MPCISGNEVLFFSVMSNFNKLKTPEHDRVVLESGLVLGLDC